MHFRTLWLSAACGMASPILISNISRVLGIWGSDGVYLVAGFVFFVLGGFLAYRIPLYLSLAGLFAVFSIAVGVFVDAALDFFLRAYDRNLWPLEILLWWVFAPVPMVLGALTGKVFARRKKRNMDKS